MAAIPRVNGAGWGSGDPLTSAQMNTMDTQINTLALNKTGDTITGLIASSGAGRLIPSQLAGVDADTTINITQGQNIVFAPATLTNNRIYTLSNTSASAGDVISVWNFSVTYTVTIKDNGGTTLTTLDPNNSGGIYPVSARFSWVNGGWVIASTFNHRIQWVESLKTANGNFTVPANVNILTITACGGGGGGGGGCGTGGAVPSTWAAGGGGGGGAQISTQVVAVTPGAVIPFVIGAAGAAGAGSSSTAGGNGGNGGDTTFGSGPTLATFPGAQGGQGGVGTYLSTSYAGGYTGGGSTRCGAAVPREVVFATTALFEVLQLQNFPGKGGGGVMNDNTPNAIIAATHGCVSTTGFDGGSQGALNGLSAGSAPIYRGGGAGGGGAGGAFGVGANGASGGNANNAGTGVNGSSASSPAANTGAGGGGGGAGGAGSTGTGTGGNGGTGGSGFMIITYVA